jgi:hypothetical protein
MFRPNLLSPGLEEVGICYGSRNVDGGGFDVRPHNLARSLDVIDMYFQMRQALHRKTGIWRASSYRDDLLVLGQYSARLVNVN